MGAKTGITIAGHIEHKENDTVSDNPHRTVAKSWLPGFRLGFVVMLFFGIGFGIILFLTGVTGWQASYRWFAALLLGPIVGTVLFLAAWGLVKPALLAALEREADPEGTDEA